MEHRFWREKWETSDLGFHQEEFNPLLLRHWPDLDLPVPGKVFVPLCGKSGDMLWLAEQGYDVVGVELSEIAARSFFSEHGMEATREEAGPFIRHRSGRIQILCGDFFSLTPAMLRDVIAVFDRAALIALPAAMRIKYVEKLGGLLQSGVKTLLITLTYRDGQITAPPHRVYDDEVRALYTPWCELELLEESETVIRDHTCPQSAYRLLTR